MIHTNEKFSIGAARSTAVATTEEQKTNEADPAAGQSRREEIEQQHAEDPAAAQSRREEIELQQALEQIRQMENQESVAKEANETVNKIDEYLEQGEFVYELYSIMIHSGGAFGGHYYAYVKSFEDGKWYNFNDSSVTAIENEQELFKTFGDGSGSSGTAYLLMYRKITSSEPELAPFNESQVPEYLKSEIEAETAKLVKEQKLIEEKLLNLNLKLYYGGDV